ncbi:hypothetical protein SCH01S_28_00740 [Sphingomonas changbaiensis NBRC 104936]|uniref:Uncharacterized protein n=1 Tax=Sphingomonas changbaiensis NBRC 104936 TaxID=1219043 RepID=A0A0E9MQ08_9SPHN|nr:hypothetical protein [Sphingomonas changbaiensis]GAO39215.1 hypothetical protein SCH01S_28_00740 [Sphingomonas changbaiensis NBRC 104936]
MRHRREATNIFDQDKRRLHQFDNVEIGVYHSAARIVWISSPVGGETLTGWTASNQIDGTPKRSQVRFVISGDCHDVVWSNLQPIRPTVRSNFSVDQICAISGKRIRMGFHCKVAHEPRTDKPKGKPAAAGKQIDEGRHLQRHNG